MVNLEFELMGLRTTLNWYRLSHLIIQTNYEINNESAIIRCTHIFTQHSLVYGHHQTSLIRLGAFC